MQPNRLPVNPFKNSLEGAQRNADPNRLSMLSLIVEREALPDLRHTGTNDRIGIGVIVQTPAENLAPDHSLFQELSVP